MKNKAMELKLFKINKEVLVTFIFILFCILLYVKFPSIDYFQSRIKTIFFLILIPYLYQKFILRKKSNLNFFSIGDYKKNSILMGLNILPALILTAFIFRFTNILDHYPLSVPVMNDFWQFLSYELIGVAFTVLLYEIFFRGFVMFYFVEFFGKWSILIQMICFIFMILLLGIPFAYYFWYLIFIPFAGWIAYRSNSVLYSFLGQLIFIIIVDASAIRLLVK